MQERAVEEVKLAIKPFYQRRDINKDEYKEILRKAVQKVNYQLCSKQVFFFLMTEFVCDYFVCLVNRCATVRVGRSTQ